MGQSESSIYWLRLDLRLTDNPALRAACARGRPVLPLYIWSPEEEGDFTPGGASRWWLHQSLRLLDEQFRRLGSRIILRRGSASEVLRQLAAETGAKAVFWNRRYEPLMIARDDRVRQELQGLGLEVETYNAGLLYEPPSIQNKAGKPFQVFTAFWKHCVAQRPPGPPLAAPRAIPLLDRWPPSLALNQLELEPKIDWAEGLRSSWEPGEVSARTSLRSFVQQRAAGYGVERNFPGRRGTSRLSPHLHFGEISPRQIFHAIDAGADPQFLVELGWREFAHHLLYYFPHTATMPLRPQFQKMRWRKQPDWLRAWQRGRTGYPIVDAGMRELWQTGWMHNRVRMITASFLVKDLLISWRAGAEWFWDTLVDADLAQNTLGWQWTAGCGADATPFFRVFNPVRQGEKFDPDGEYVRKWCPELADVPSRWIHEPWSSPKPPPGYPEPIVRHIIAREVALEEYSRIRRPRTSGDI